MCVIETLYYFSWRFNTFNIPGGRPPCSLYFHSLPNTPESFRGNSMGYSDYVRKSIFLISAHPPEKVKFILPLIFSVGPPLSQSIRILVISFFTPSPLFCLTYLGSHHHPVFVRGLAPPERPRKWSQKCWICACSVRFCRGFAGSRRLLLFGETTSALGIRTDRKVLLFFIKYRQGKKEDKSGFLKKKQVFLPVIFCAREFFFFVWGECWLFFTVAQNENNKHFYTIWVKKSVKSHLYVVQI